MVDCQRIQEDQQYVQIKELLDVLFMILEIKEPQINLHGNQIQLLKQKETSQLLHEVIIREEVLIQEGQQECRGLVMQAELQGLPFVQVLQEVDLIMQQVEQREIQELLEDLQ